MKIRMDGPWPLVWVGWGMSYLGWLLWSSLFATAWTQHFGLAVLFSVWAPLEAIGAMRNTIKDRTEPEMARTLSQVLQRAVQEEHEYRAWYRGYPGLVTFAVLSLTWGAWLSFSPFDVVMGGLIACAVFAYLMWHLLRRGIYG